MKQKLGIAGAMMENPKMLILDEPFNGLDEESVDKVRQLIMERRGKDSLTIISCHDSDEIDKICDEIITIKLGKIVSVEDNKRDNKDEN